MTKSNHTYDVPMETEETRARPILGQILFYFGVCLAFGGIAGGSAVFPEKGFTALTISVIGSIVAIGIALIWASIRIGNFDPPSLSTKTGRSQLILLISCAIGGFLGIYASATGLSRRLMAGDLSLTATEAIVALALLFAVALPISIIREKSIDDFERTATRDAAYWTLSAYIYGYLGWKLGELGSLLPPVDDGLLFLAILFLFLGLWITKRSG